MGVSDYLAALADDRREVIDSLRSLILAHLPAGYEESIAYGMLSYQVPLARFSATHNKLPLAYISLAAQARHYSLYLCGLYMDEKAAAALRKAFAADGRKLDMGKSCIRFKRLEDLNLDAVAAVVAAHPVEDFIKIYQLGRASKRRC